MLIPYNNDVKSLNYLIETIFKDIYNYSENFIQMTNQVILIPKNQFVNEINVMLIHRFLNEIV